MYTVVQLIDDHQLQHHSHLGFLLDLVHHSPKMHKFHEKSLHYQMYRAFKTVIEVCIHNLKS